MLSRTADHLYWMARYMERLGRSHNTARREASCGVLCAQGVERCYLEQQTTSIGWRVTWNAQRTPRACSM
ncbi:MAG: alpha-E domain-containing protein [Rhizobacter sp.]